MYTEIRMSTATVNDSLDKFITAFFNGNHTVVSDMLSSNSITLEQVYANDFAMIKYAVSGCGLKVLMKLKNTLFSNNVGFSRDAYIAALTVLCGLDRPNDILAILTEPICNKEKLGIIPLCENDYALLKIIIEKAYTNVIMTVLDIKIKSHLSITSYDFTNGQCILLQKIITHADISVLNYMFAKIIRLNEYDERSKIIAAAVPIMTKGISTGNTAKIDTLLKLGFFNTTHLSTALSLSLPIKGTEREQFEFLKYIFGISLNGTRININAVRNNNYALLKYAMTFQDHAVLAGLLNLRYDGDMINVSDIINCNLLTENYPARIKVSNFIMPIYHRFYCTESMPLTIMRQNNYALLKRIISELIPKDTFMSPILSLRCGDDFITINDLRNANILIKMANIHLSDYVRETAMRCLYGYVITGDRFNKGDLLRLSCENFVSLTCFNYYFFEYLIDQIGITVTDFNEANAMGYTRGSTAISYFCFRYPHKFNCVKYLCELRDENDQYISFDTKYVAEALVRGALKLHEFYKHNPSNGHLYYLDIARYLCMRYPSIGQSILISASYRGVIQLVQFIVDNNFYIGEL